jgi:MFS family permease
MDRGLAYTRRERIFVAASAILGFGFDFYNLIILAFLVKPIQDSLGISLQSFGLIVAASLASSVVGGVLFGWVGDKIGRKKALFGSLLLLAVGSTLSAFSWNFSSLLFFRVLTGVGVGGEWGAGMVLLNEVWDSRRRGLGSSMVQAMSYAGTALAVVVATVALANLPADTAWRLAMMVSGLPVLLMLFVRSKMPESRLWLEYQRRLEAGELPPEKLSKSGPLVELFRGSALKSFMIGTVICGSYVIASQSVTIFMPTLMLRDLGANLADLRSITLIVAAVSAIGMIGTGYFSDSWGRRRTVLISTAISVVGAVLIYISGTGRFPGSYLGWPLFGAYLVWGFGQGAIGQFGPWYAELYPVEMRNTATSTIFTTGRLLGSIAPYLVPIIATATGSLREAMMLAIPGSVISFVFALLLPETAGRSFAVVDHVIEGADVRVPAD